ncbi:protein OBERON 3-like [Lycium barbarum]|uniref:protein OBERON 3-like n=1 Tax=Lycium barbarum TaxID=112863 RepID=UPI00293EA638|nr:protein OBERON 3-like [Lycium barbarum]
MSVRGNSSKRIAENDEEYQAEKKPKGGNLNLSLALPDVDIQSSLELSNNNTRIGYFRNGSLLSCYSHPFSHNLSYSLTLSSEEDSEYSVKGLNWSDFTLPCGSSLALNFKLVNKEILCDNDIDRISSSNSNSLFLFELPARPTGDSRVSGSMDPWRILGEIVSQCVPHMAQMYKNFLMEQLNQQKNTSET